MYARIRAPIHSLIRELANCLKWQAFDSSAQTSKLIIQETPAEISLFHEGGNTMLLKPLGCGRVFKSRLNVCLNLEM